MPFAFLQGLDSPEVIFDDAGQWWGERSEGVKRTIQLLNEKDVQVMLKPQIWIRHGKFTGEIKMTSEKNWGNF